MSYQQAKHSCLGSKNPDIVTMVTEGDYRRVLFGG